jgi:hypothetical protein
VVKYYISFILLIYFFYSQAILARQCLARPRLNENVGQENNLDVQSRLYETEAEAEVNKPIEVFEDQKWTGIDVSIVGKYAEKYGHPPRDPYINTDQGDLLLFVFTVAGVIGGFIIGYNFRKLFVEGDNCQKIHQGKTHPTTSLERERNITENSIIKNEVKQ